MRIHKTLFFAVFSVLIFFSSESRADTIETEYFAVFVKLPEAPDSIEQSLGSKIGYAIQSRKVEADRVVTSIKLDLTIGRFGTPVTVETQETFIETIEGKALGFESVQLLSGIRMKISGMIDSQGVINATVESMGTVQKTTSQWPPDAIMAEGLRLLTLKKGLKEGPVYNVKQFIPSMLQALETEVKIGGKKDVGLLGRQVRLTEVVSTVELPGAGNIVSTDYVDDDLRVQKSISNVAGIDIVMIACAKEFALSDNEPVEFVSRMFLKSPRPIDNIDTADAITYYLSLTDDKKTDKPLSIPTTDSQTVRMENKGNVIVTVKPATVPEGSAFPYKGKDKIILTALKPGRFVQSDNKKIIALARKAVGDTRDAAGAARKIEAFVADYIEAGDLSVGYASAAEVAEFKKGDCSEFAVLTAAMCRAVGIPAQVVMGIAYIKDYRGIQNSFGGHAWVQAYLGGRWIGLDASFKKADLGGFGPGHIALSVGNGDPEDFFALVTTVGRFKIDKIELNPE